MAQNKPKKSSDTRPKSKPKAAARATRGAAHRASRRNADDAQKRAYLHSDASTKKLTKPRANKIDDSPHLRIVGLGGMDSTGSKNMIVLEYQNDAIVIDVGNDLGVNLPGINYGIPDVTYLESIRNKLKGYVITHGHLDHIGGLPHILPKVPAPVYGSRFTIGMVEQIIANTDAQLDDKFELKTVILNQDNHERIRIGQHFTVELVRVTHAIPGSTLVVVDTPVGRVINTGDFKIDPDPLDHKPTDLNRLRELGKEGVHVLLSESTNMERPGRTPTEHVLEPTFHDVIKHAPGRVFTALFSSNVNRIQMVVNAAVAEGRKVALDGRSMMQYLETAVRLGFIKIPKGTFVPMANVNNFKDTDIVIMCTGSQGEPNSALQRMSTGDHKHVKLKAQDTVVLSSTPIPETGNDAEVGRMVDDLLQKNVHVYQHITHELDGIGPLHVSGHGGVEEYGEMIDMLKPTYFLPIYGSYRYKQRHIELAVERGIPRKNTYNAGSGQVMEFTKNRMEANGEVPHGTLLVDNTGAIVSNVVVKDRLMLAEDGLVNVVLTIDKQSGQLLSSPDIVSRGFIYMRDNEELMNDFRTELKRVVGQRFKRVDLDRFKTELKDHITYFLFERTQRSPIIIPVVNVVNGKAGKQKLETARAELLGQDQRD